MYIYTCSYVPRLVYISKTLRGSDAYLCILGDPGPDDVTDWSSPPPNQRPYIINEGPEANTQRPENLCPILCSCKCDPCVVTDATIVTVIICSPPTLSAAVLALSLD